MQNVTANSSEIDRHSDGSCRQRLTILALASQNEKPNNGTTVVLPVIAGLRP